MIAWGSTAPNSAVNGLTTLLGREEWSAHADGELIRKLLEPQLDSLDETVRMLASMALPMLVKAERLTDELSDRLMREESESVIEVLIRVLADHVTSDPVGIDTCLGRLATRSTWSGLASKVEDRSTPPNKRPSELGDLLVKVLLYLGLVCTTPFVCNLLRSWQREPQDHPATLGRLVAWARHYLDPREEVGTAAQAQARAFELLTSLSNACVSITTLAEETFAIDATLSDHQRQDLEAAAWIAHCIAQEIYHASGAFQTQQQKSQLDERVVSPSFCSLAFPIIEKLAAVRFAGIAHHLVQTLAFLSRREPQRAFMAVARIATPGSGYGNESLAEIEVLDLVDLYLAERRQIILADPECLSGLRGILETFVAVGSDRAIRRVQDLGELFT